jgi:hypothetical protein
VKLGGKSYRMSARFYDLTGHYAISNSYKYGKFFKVYGVLAGDIVENEFNNLEPKYKLFRPLKWNSRTGNFK